MFEDDALMEYDDDDDSEVSTEELQWSEWHARVSEDREDLLVVERFSFVNDKISSYIHLQDVSIMRRSAVFSSGMFDVIYHRLAFDLHVLLR